MQRVTQADILDILQAFEHSSFARLDLVFGSVRIAVNRASAAAANSVVLPLATAQVVAPLLGVFQAGPESGAPAFVQLGSKVQTDTTVGIIRVMQDTTAVKAGLRGTIVDVLVRDGQFIEFGQALLRVSAESAAQESCSPDSSRENVR
jgi:acetyl-CoA carboxylase biotin carboxyl carrier protein